MSKGKVFFVIMMVCLFDLHVSKICAQDTPELEYIPGELLVRFAPTTRGEQLNIVSKNMILTSLGGATLKHDYKFVTGLSLIKLPENQKVEDVLSTFNANESILYAEPNYKIWYADNHPNDPCYAEQWGLHNIGQTGGETDADIDAPEAWDIRTNADPNIIVAVIDTGVDYTHPDLADNMWINEQEYSGTTGIDDDGNGYVDDIYGYDFCTWGNKQRDSDPEDDNGHGTHIAGIIGAVGNNNKYVSGVCWNVKIMAVKSFLTRLYPCDKVKWSY